MMMYCLKFKSKKEAINLEEFYSKNNKPMITGNYSSCGTKVCQFIKKGSGVVNTLLNKFQYQRCIYLYLKILNLRM